jgi:hypothetical protein
MCPALLEEVYISSMDSVWRVTAKPGPLQFKRPELNPLPCPAPPPHPFSWFLGWKILGHTLRTNKSGVAFLTAPGCYTLQTNNQVLLFWLHPVVTHFRQTIKCCFFDCTWLLHCMFDLEKSWSKNPLFLLLFCFSLLDKH